MQGAVCQSFFYFKTDVKDSVIRLGNWQTFYLVFSARLVLQEVEVTVQFHC